MATGGGPKTALGRAGEMADHDVPWKAHVDDVIDSRCRELMALIRASDVECKAMITALDKRLDAATCNFDRRFEAGNEIREAMRDQAARFPTREEMLHLLAPIEVHIQELRESRGLLLRPIETNIQELREWRANLSGMATQESVNEGRKEAATAKLFAVIGLVVGIIGTLTGVIIGTISLVMR